MGRRQNHDGEEELSKKIIAAIDWAIDALETVNDWMVKWPRATVALAVGAIAIVIWIAV